MLKSISLISLIFSMTAFCQTWQSIGPDGGFFKDFVIHPTNSDIVYAGSDDGGGVWKTIDGGNSWELLTEEFVNFTGWSIEMDLDHPDTLYFCEIYGRYGILKTTDGGETFEHLTDGFELNRDFQTSQMIIYPGNGDTLFASTGEEADFGRVGNGIFCSYNGGTTWNYSGLQNRSIPCIEITENRILAGTVEHGLQYSDDVGVTWVIHPDIPDTASILEVDQMNDIIAISAGANGVFISDDNGVTFENIGRIGEFNFDLAILQTSPSLEIITTGFFFPARYNSVLADWFPIFDPLFVDHLLIGIDAKDGIIYSGIFSSTQIIKSTDNGMTWSQLEKNPTVTEIRAIAVNPVSGKLFASLQNSYNFAGDRYNKESLAYSEDDGASWKRTGPLAHGLDLKMHPEKPETIFLATFAQGLFKTEDGFETWENAREGNVFISDVEINPNNPNEVMIGEVNIGLGEVGVFKSTDEGEIWAEISSILITKIQYVEGSDTIYFASENGVFMSNDNGESILPVAVFLEGENVTGLKHAEETLYIGTEEGELYKVESDGVLQEITGGWNVDLPTEIVNIEHYDNSLIIGLDGAEQDTLHNLNGGVWQSIDGGETWSNISTNLSNDNIFGNTGIGRDTDGQLLVGTYGRGVFKSTGAVLSLQKDNLENSFKVYPNPVTDYIEIQFDTNTKAKTITIESFDSKIILNQLLISENSFRYNTEKLSKGTYIVSVNHNGNISQKKFVKN